MNNEPVAYVDNVWINRPDLAMDLGIGQMFSRCQLSDHQIPLYTHPVKDLANALTEKEITDLWCEVYSFKGYDCLTELDFKFCKEIIRKAQEK